MKNMLILFIGFVIYPLTLQAGEGLELEQVDSQFFDELPVEQSEVNSVSRIFWNAKSIQENVKSQLPEQAQKRFSKADGCDIKAVIKTEGSAEICELNDDPDKNAKYIYRFSVSCSSGKYQVSVCSRQSAQLMNQLKVINPEKLVSDDNVFDLDSTM